MRRGSAMPIVTTMEAGASIAAAVHPAARSCATGGAGAATAVIVAAPLRRYPIAARGSALERLVPPLLERGVVLREIAVVEIDQALSLVRVEADPLLRLGRNLDVGDAPVVAHVLGKGLLGRRLQHFIEPDVR